MAKTPTPITLSSTATPAQAAAWGFAVAPTTPPAYAPPPDATYDNQVSNANLSYGNTTTDLDYQQARGGQTYGFDASGNVDPSNPFSRAALLMRSFQDAQRGTANNYAARGQLYAGSVNNAQAMNQHNYDVGYDQLRRSAEDYYHEITRRRQIAGETRDASITDAEAQRLPSDIEANRPSDAPTSTSAPKKTPYYKTAAYRSSSLKTRQRYWKGRRAARGY